MLRWILTLAMFAGSMITAQSCPRNDPNGPSVPSVERTLEGDVVLHQGIRTWSELRLEKVECGEKSIQLVPDDISSPKKEQAGYSELEALRGCHVTVRGLLDIPATGYYSAELYMNVRAIEADAECKRKPPLPDYSKLKPPLKMRHYHVTILVDYGGEGSVRAVIAANGQQWRPWQAYASYMLTGGFVFYGRCADGFSMTHVGGTPAASVGQTDEVASMDPENAAEKGVRLLRMSFTCSR